MKKDISKHHYTIMPLDEKHIDEICLDIKKQYESGVATLALFMMVLVPEGNPVINKVEDYCRVYDLYRNKLSEMGLECGVLVQASIGHGYPLNEEAPFQKYIGRTDGVERNKYCPYDLELREYLKHAMKVISSHRPKAIMVDDDFRLLFFYGKGCTCPLHMKRFNELAGTRMTREELNEIIEANGENDEIVKIYLETQKESLIGAAKSIREGIDSVDPTIQGLYCTTGSGCEFAIEIAEILAGKDNPSVIRTFNGVYCPQGTKGFSTALYRIAQHRAILQQADYIIAEVDTCPQNRYALNASQLHAYYVGAILEGTNGSKKWITRLQSFEPESGVAYRKILTEYKGFYETLTELASEITPVGCCTVVQQKSYYGLREDAWEFLYDGWSRCVLERLGVPLFFSAVPRGAVFLEGDVDKHFSDKEILDFLSGTVRLASDTAKNLDARGFSEYMGVKVNDYSKKALSGETILSNKNICQIQKNSKELIVLNENVKVQSLIYHSCDFGKTKEDLFPGSTVYKNSLGGTVVVFAGTPVAQHYYDEGFSFLNYTRKLQLIDILKQTGNLPVYYPGDLDVYIRAGILPDGNLFTVAFNLSFDSIEKLELVVEKKVNEVLLLLPNGSFTQLDFIQKEDLITLNIEVKPLLPIALIIK